MKLTEAKLKQIIVETLNEVNRNVQHIIKQHQLLAMENAIQSIPEEDPLFNYREKLMGLLKTPWPLNGVRQVYSLIDGMSPDSPAAQLFGNIIEETEFFLELKGYDTEGNKLPGAPVILEKIEEKIRKIALDNRAEIRKNFDPVEIGRQDEATLMSELEFYFRTEMEEDPEFAEIFEKANRLLKRSNLRYFDRSISDFIRFHGLVQNILQQHLEYPQW